MTETSIWDDKVIHLVQREYGAMFGVSMSGKTLTIWAEKLRDYTLQQVEDCLTFLQRNWDRIRLERRNPKAAPQLRDILGHLEAHVAAQGPPKVECGLCEEGRNQILWHDPKTNYPYLVNFPCACEAGSYLRASDPGLKQMTQRMVETAVGLKQEQLKKAQAVHGLRYRDDPHGAHWNWMRGEQRRLVAEMKGVE